MLSDWVQSVPVIGPMFGAIQREEMPTLLSWMFRLGLSGLFVMLLYSGWEIRDQQMRDRHQDQSLKTAVRRLDNNIDRLEEHQRYQDTRLNRHRRRMGRIQALIREGLINDLMAQNGKGKKGRGRHESDGRRTPNPNDKEETP